MKALSRSLLVFLLCQLITFQAFAQQIAWDAPRPSFRGMNAKLCQIYLSPEENGVVSDSAGIPIKDKNDREGFREGIRQVLQEKGSDYLTNSTITVTGVDMRDGKKTRREFTETLKELGLENQNIKLRVIQVPSKIVVKNAKDAVIKILQRLRYLMPNFEWDFEKPIMGEVLTGLAMTAGIEVANFAYIYRTFPFLEANLTATANLSTIAAYVIFTKFMGNWLMRTPTRLERFAQQVTLSIPFVLSYNVFPNLHPILDFIGNHSTVETLLATAAQSGHFFVAQAPTLLLQTAFFVGLVSGVQGWIGRQTGENLHIARIVGPINSGIPQVPDAVFLTMASNSGTTLFNIGPTPINTGHQGLGYLNLIVYGAFFLMPDLLNPTIKLYKKMPWYKAAKAEK